MGDLVGSLGESLGLIAPEGAGSGSAAQARSLEERAIKELEKLDIPPMEAQQLVLERPELVAQLIPEVLGDSAMGGIEISQGLKDAQLEGLEGAQELAEYGGFTPDTMAKFEALRRQSEGDAAARDASIMQSLAQRSGGVGQGAELATRLASSQAATQRGADVSKDMLMQAPSARLQAIQGASNMAGQMRGQEFGEQATAAQAQDVINKFNTGLKQQAQQYNIGEKQRLADTRTGLQHQEEKQRAGLYQQKFQNELEKATGVAKGYGGLAKGYETQAGAEAQAAQDRAAGTRGLVFGGAKAAAGFMEDGGVKRDHYQDGGVERGMNYEAGGMGTIVETGQEDDIGQYYAGDRLPDRINEGEAVLNLDMQDTIKSALNAADRVGRTDEQVQMGMAQVNPDAQDELMAVARGQMSPGDMSDKPIVEKKKSKLEALNDLLDMLRDSGEQQ